MTPDPYFDQFDPTKRTGNTGVNGGSTGTPTPATPPSGYQTLGDLGSRFQQLGATNTPGPYTPGAAAQPNIPGVDPSLQNHQTGAVDPAEWARLIQGLPPITGDGDLTGLNTLSDRLKTEGYQVSPGPIDAQGRSDSLVINGQLVRISDSGGNYIYKPDSAANPAWESGSGGGANGGVNNDWWAPYTGQATMPSLADFQNSPGYQAGLDATNKGVQASAAAKGDLLDGGTLRKLGQADANYVTQGYGQFVNQNMNNLAFNRDSFFANQSNPFSKTLSLLQLGKPAQ